MALEYSNRRNSNTQLLRELEALSLSLFQNNTAATHRRTASLALPRTSFPSITSTDETNTNPPTKTDNKPASITHLSRRMPLSPGRSWPKLDDNSNPDSSAQPTNQTNKLQERSRFALLGDRPEKKGIWNWKPIRALSHIGMQKLSCLFSVEVVAVQGLPASMNGLWLSVCVRKKETKDGAVRTMPSRVSQGAADFKEMLFVRCHVYCTPVSGKNQQLKFEPRPFWIYAFTVDAEEPDFGRSWVDLSHLIQESMEKGLEGTRVRQWDTSFNLSGKAKGGELVIKMGFQIIEDGGVDVYSQAEGMKSSKSSNFSSLFGRRQSKTSFGVPSPRMTTRAEAWTPSQAKAAGDLQGIDDLNLDEPVPLASSSSLAQKSEEPEAKGEDLDIPEFEVVDKGFEIQDKEEAGDGESEENVEEKSASSKVVKEIVHNPLHPTRLTELDSIATQIKALEDMMGEEKIVKMAEEEPDSQRLDADEETVTREFLQMLEDEEANTFKFNQTEVPFLQLDGGDGYTDAESKVYVSDLGKGLGCVVQTRDGGYLAAMNSLDAVVGRKDTPKLAMQLSKPLVVRLQESMSGFEVFQKMTAVGFEELSSQILSLMPMDELMGKTAEQVAFEGMASAIVQGCNKEGASSSAARTIATVKAMCAAMNTDRKNRISTGIWNASESPLSLDEILAFSLQKVEAMAIEALKIQAEMAEEDAPFDVSSPSGNTSTVDGKEQSHPLGSAIPLEESMASCKGEWEKPATIAITVAIQLRDPMRRYEAVGGRLLALIVCAARADTEGDKYGEEKKFKVTSLHVGGMKVRRGEKRNVWDTEGHRLTAMQWLVAYGMGKGGKKGKRVLAEAQDLLWSISSRMTADMWRKTIRNPDVKFTK